jgi:hypothetical protein
MDYALGQAGGFSDQNKGSCRYRRNEPSKTTGGITAWLALP